MNKLYNYLNKIGATYQKNTFGCNYFFNVAPLHFEGVTITLDYSNMSWAAIDKNIRNYCNRYGYTIFRRGGYPGYSFYSIMKNSDKKALDQYNEYSTKSHEAIENYIHIGTTDNDFLKGVMEFWGEEYLKSIA